MAIGLENVSFHSSLKEGQYQRLFKLLYSCIHSKVGYEILQGGLRQDVNQELSDVQLDVGKAEKPKVKLQHPSDHRKSKGIPKKHLLLLH